MALEPIKPLDVAQPDRADVQRRVIAAVEADPERFLTAYAAHKDSYGGRYVCADLMKDVIPEYAASKEARGRYNAVVHNAAAVLAAEQYRRVIADGSDPARTEALFVTGMPGAGKTSQLQRAAAVAGDRLSPDIRVIYEGQLVDAGSSAVKVQQAIDAGLHPTVVAVLPRPEQALEFSIKRFDEYGRGAGVGVMTRIQEGTPDGLNGLLERFGDRIAIEVHDVRDRLNPVRHNGRDGIEVWQEELSHGSVRERLTTEFERRRAAGLVSEDAQRQFRGEPPYQERFAVHGRDARRSAGNVPGRSDPEGDGDTSILNAARGGPPSGLLRKVEGAPPDGAEQVVVMNGSRLHESRHDGEWVVQGEGPQGMLPRGVYRLDTAKPANEAEGAEHRGAILHVGPKGIFQDGDGGVVRHDPARFQVKPAIGEAAVIAYGQGRAVLANRGPAPTPEQSKGRSR